MDIKFFSNCDFGEIRIAINENGKALFCLLDVCKALGLSNPSMVKERLDFSNIFKQSHEQFKYYCKCRLRGNDYCPGGEAEEGTREGCGE